jgi:arsenate reductase
MSYTVAFICTHNACRSQMAEALARKLIPDPEITFCSAGSDPIDAVDPKAVSLMKKIYGIDMSAQHPKTIHEIPDPDLAISMGCSVRCPFIGRDFDDNWNLPDPMGKDDQTYRTVISEIEQDILLLRQKLPH